MKKHLLLFITVLVTFTAGAQEHAWVYFTGKPNATTSLANPLSILTQDALDRKAMHGVAVDFRDVPVDETYITTIKSQPGITVKAKSKWMNCVHVTGSETDIDALLNLAIVDSIFYADISMNSSRAAHTKKEVKTSDKLDINTDFTYGNSSNQITMLNVDDLHQNNYTGEGMVIAVLDAGFPNVSTLNGFQRMRDNNDLLGGYDFVLRSTNYNNPSLNSHGVMVLSDMAGFVQDMFVGTAPDASYYLFRTEDATTESPVEESYWVEAAERADSLGVDVINSSLGYSNGFYESRFDHTMDQMDGNTTFITKGANIAIQKGILVVCSAGNSGNDPDFNIISAPADGNVFTIGAVTSLGNYASFSSIGPSADGRVKPDVMAQGQLSAIINQSDQLTNGSGTSFSSPIMAGSIASFWQANPSKTNLEIMQLVRESASLYSAPTNQMGYGIPDFSVALTNLLAAKQFDLAGSVHIYPNPVNNMLNIQLGIAGEPDVIIYDTLGRIRLQKSQVTSGQVDVSALPAGLYLLTITSNGKSVSVKLLKQ